MSAHQPSPAKQWAEALLWLDRADLDTAAAEALLTQSNTLVDAAAFHCQQAAEKMAKAVLVGLGREPAYTHDISTLSKLVSADRSEIGAAIENLSGLTAWYITSRYPGQWDSTPTVVEVQTMLLRLREVRRLIAGLAPKAS